MQVRELIEILEALPEDQKEARIAIEVNMVSTKMLLNADAERRPYFVFSIE